MDKEETKKPLISIIIPIYNMQSYLDRCLSSIQMQTYKNLEILLVNDGSEDDSGKIADKYAESDDRFKVFHLENGGVSAARNFGLRNFKGDYVAFIDADDFVDIHYIDLLYQAISATDSKMAVCQIHTCGEDLSEYQENDLQINPQVYYLDNNYNYTQPYARFSVCATLFERELVKEKRFSKELFMGEDALFVAEVMNQCGKYAQIHQKLYVYVIYNQSSSHGKYTEKHRTEIYAAQRLIQVYNHKSEMFLRNLDAWYCFVCLNNIKLMFLHNAEDKEWYMFLLREARARIIPFIKSNYSITRKVFGIMQCFFPKITNGTYRLLKK